MMGYMVPIRLIIMAILLPQCMARDYFKLQPVLWPSDAAKVQETSMPSRFACGSWCSTLGTECSVFQFNVTGNCKVSKLGLISPSSFTETRKSSWLKRGLPMSVEGGTLFSVLFFYNRSIYESSS